MPDIRAIQIECLKKLGYQFEEKDIPFPDENWLKFGVAVLVDYKTSVDEQCQRLGIANRLKVFHHGNRYSTPTNQWGWIYGVIIKENGGTNPHEQVAGAYCCYSSCSRPLMTVEGLAFYRENHELFKNRIVDFPGSACSVDVLDCDTSLVWDGDKPELDTNYVEIAI